jgi:hypothetical protein
VVPSVATNNRMVLKPSEKVPLSAYYFADLLYEAGLPPEMLQIVTGDPLEIADELLTHRHVDLITFTGGVPIGKTIASKAGYRRMVLELGGNDPLIVMDDADLDKASELAVQGSYKTRASAARPSSACWCTRRSWPASPSASSRRPRPGATATRPIRPTRWAPSSTRRPRGTSSRSWARRWRRARGCSSATGAKGRCTRRPCSTACGRR